MRPTAQHQHASLAGGGDVGLVLVDAALEHRAPPLDEPSRALGRVPSRRGVRDLPLGKVLRVRRAAKVVPRRLDEHAPQALVAGLGDAALPHALAAGALGGRAARATPRTTWRS